MSLSNILGSMISNINDVYEFIGEKTSIIGNKNIISILPNYCLTLQDIYNLLNKNYGGSVTSEAIYENSRISKLRNCAFYSCFEYGVTHVSAVFFPNCKRVGAECFYNNTLTNISLPMCEVIEASAFEKCYKLTQLSFPRCTNICAAAFSHCERLESLYIGEAGATIIARLSSTDAFYETPIVNSSYLGHFGKIYVPNQLLNQYKQATNWAFFSSRMEGF